jgi:hypothetical protein
MHFSWKVVQARATVAEGYFPDATEQTLVASGVYTSSMMWTKNPGTGKTGICSGFRYVVAGVAPACPASTAQFNAAVDVTQQIGGRAARAEVGRTEAR